MNRKMNQKKRILSFMVMFTMLFSFVIPPNLTFAEAATKKSTREKSDSNETFTADEVNRILESLTDEQKSEINKLTEADKAEKIHIAPEDLRDPGNLDVIVEFNVEPARIQIIKKAMAQGGATVNSEAFDAEYSEAQKSVEESHEKFKNFINAQPESQIVGGGTVDNGMRITREYSEVFNGVAMSLPANQVMSLIESPVVGSVWPVVEYEAFSNEEENEELTIEMTSNTSVGKPTDALEFLGIDEIQASGNIGSGIKVGVLDTGIDYNHPDLKDVYKGGHDFCNFIIDENGNISYDDDEDPMETTYLDWIDARENPSPIYGRPSENYKTYITSHGTHVAGTIAANTTDNNSEYSANGVAPGVELYAYRVLGPGGSGMTDSVLKGIDQAVKDGMDVINLSLGAGVNDPLYPTSSAINNATLLGVVCCVAAGNAGPRTATVGSPGTAPLAITVGASDIPGKIPMMTVMNDSMSYEARLFGKSFTDKDDAFAGQSLPIVDVGYGSSLDYSGVDVTGKVVLVQRGGDFLKTKMDNAKNAGAAAMIIWNNTDDDATQGYIPSFLGVSMDNIYAVSLTQKQGQALSEDVRFKGDKATITFPEKLNAPHVTKGDELASFSSTGPVKNWDIKPDVVAPGVDIMSAAPYDIWDPQAEVESPNYDYTYAYQSMSGTSMATPHVAGIAALILAANPEYTPADVKSALMNTAKDINTDTQIYSVYQVGAGRVEPDRAINSDIKIQIQDKAYTYDNPMDSSTIKEVDNLTGSLFFGFKGRGEGATAGSDDVIQSKNFKVTNMGTESKTFNVNTEFISTKFADSNPVGPGTGNDVKIDFSVNDIKTTSVTVGGGKAVETTVKITVPTNALEGTYEGYISIVNAADESESYRLPFTITIAEKGVDFNVYIKAMTLKERYTGNYSPAVPPAGLSAYSFSVNSAMKEMYLLLKDNEGNYLGVIQNVLNIEVAGPGAIYGPMYMLLGGLYLPFTKPYDGDLEQAGIASKPEVIKEGAYAVEMVTIDGDGKHYIAEETLYVDYTAPTIKMDGDAKPGIYEIDPTGYGPGQEIKTFHGTVYDSNVDIMKDNGEISVTGIDDINELVPVDQALNAVWGYVDSYFPSVMFRTDSNGRFSFGITREDIKPLGENFWFYPIDYSLAGDLYTGKQQYYFIEKGSPYITMTNSGGVDPDLEKEGKVVVGANQTFKVAIATKNGAGMTGGKFTINNNFNNFSFSNINLSDEYTKYLEDKGITPTFTVSEPYDDSRNGGQSIDITISEIDQGGALVDDMDILVADAAYTKGQNYVGPLDYFLTKSSFTYSGTDKKVAAFPANMPYITQSTSVLSGGLFAESFRNNVLDGLFTGITVASGAKVKATDSNGEKYITDEPTSKMNTVQYAGNIAGTYALTMDASPDPYDLEISMPGHFTGYKTTPVIGTNKFGYQSGNYYDIPSYDTPLLLGGDVNGDNVIDIKDALEEAEAYARFKECKTIEDKTAFLKNPENRKYDIRYGATTYASPAAIDYFDFYYIFKNFGKVNETAPNVDKLTPQLKLKDNTKVNDVELKAGDGIDEIRAALNFKAPEQRVSNATLADLQRGASITLSPSNSIFLDDEIWRNSITEISLDGKNITDATIPGTEDKAVTIKAGYMYFDPIRGSIFEPAKIVLNNALFKAAKKYEVIIKADGYQDLVVPLNVTADVVATPIIPLVMDPERAHIGKDLTLSFPEDATWRQGINKIVVKTQNWSTGIDITNLTDDSGKKYYDISEPGQITFNKDLFMAEVATNKAPITPGSGVYNPQLYTFIISSEGYPDNTLSEQPVGYGVTFDSQGGSAINPIAVGYNPSKTVLLPMMIPLGQLNPAPTKSGYVFTGWYYDTDCTKPFQSSVDLYPTATHPYPKEDITVYAGWDINCTQNYSPVDKDNPDGKKFDGTPGSSGKGWILGEGDVKVTIPDLTNTPWFDSITKIEAEYYPVDADTGNNYGTLESYTIDESTYKIETNEDGSGTISFTTATEAYAKAHPEEKFAFTKPAYQSYSPYNGYKLIVSVEGYPDVQLSNLKLGYRIQYDLNGGALVNSKDSYMNDRLVFDRESAPNLLTVAQRVTNGDYSLDTTCYYYDSDCTNPSDVSMNHGDVPHDNLSLYLCWGKTAPKVSKDMVENILGKDITLTFPDDEAWRSSINEISIGSRILDKSEYSIKAGAITIDKSVFTEPQKININIKATGYVDANVQEQVVGYMVNFESDGGSYIAPQVAYSRATKPEDPIKVGYSFKGWYTDSALTEPFDFGTIITAPITIYAKYALTPPLVSRDTTDNCVGNDITLTFPADDPEWVKNITDIKINGSIVEKDKYTVEEDFITIDKSLFPKAATFSIVIGADMYADVNIAQLIIDGYNINFVLEGDAPFEVQDQIVARRITKPVVEGYTIEWYADAEYTNPWDFTNSIYSDRTLYGKWEKNDCTVTFDSQGGSAVDSVGADYDTTIAEPTAPTREGYTFGGWYKDAECINPWDFAVDKVTADITLYAKWTISDYTVTFDSKGGSAVESIGADHDTIIAEPTAPTKAGYTFEGWYKEAECINPWDFAVDKVTSDITLYAKWTTNKYTVTFDSQGGSAVDSIIADYGTTVAEPTAPTKEGYDFGGWYQDAECTIPWNFKADRVTGDTILYAKWTINKYTVTFDSQGGSAVDSVDADYDTTIAEPEAPTREGFTFGGWFKDAECTTPWDFAADKVTEDTILYAKWTSNDKYKVTFDSQGGSAVDGVYAEYDTIIAEPKAPTREGYTFGGWFKDAECTIPWDFKTDKVTADITLYAKWTVAKYTVTFDSKGGSGVDSIGADYNATIKEPKAPTRKGYKFGGWYKDAACKDAWDFEKDKVTADTTLYAKWIADPPVSGGDDGSNNGSGQGGSNLPQTGSPIGTTVLWFVGILLLASGCFILLKKRGKSSSLKK